jgi:hypothetical protein
MIGHLKLLFLKNEVLLHYNTLFLIQTKILKVIWTFYNNTTIRKLYRHNHILLLILVVIILCSLGKEASQWTATIYDNLRIILMIFVSEFCNVHCFNFYIFLGFATFIFD